MPSRRADRAFEGLLGLTMLVAAVAFCSSGVLLFFIVGPAEFSARLQKRAAAKIN